MSELYHHGIKGQKWGVRRTPQQLGYSEGERREYNKEKYEKAKNIYKSAKKSKSDPETIRSARANYAVEKSLKKTYDAAKRKEYRQNNVSFANNNFKNAEILRKMSSEMREASGPEYAKKREIYNKQKAKAEFVSSAKASGAAAATFIGSSFVNGYLKAHDVTLNDKSLRIDKNKASQVAYIVGLFM